MKTWRTLSRRTVLDQGRFLRVELHEVALPDGQVIPDWSWVVTPEFVTVVAVTPDGRYLCFRQSKYSIEGDSLAPAGGYIEPGESPLVAVWLICTWRLRSRLSLRPMPTTLSFKSC